MGELHEQQPVCAVGQAPASTTSADECSSVARFSELTKAGEWQEAAKLIRRVLDSHPSIAVNWFNYGLCLDSLRRHDEAAEAFWRAWELAPAPQPGEERSLKYAAIYHTCRNLLEGDALEELYLVLASVCVLHPGIMSEIADNSEFSGLFHEEPFAELVRQIAS